MKIDIGPNAERFLEMMERWDESTITWGAAGINSPEECDKKDELFADLMTQAKALVAKQRIQIETTDEPRFFVDGELYSKEFDLVDSIDDEFEHEDGFRGIHYKRVTLCQPIAGMPHMFNNRTL